MIIGHTFTGLIFNQEILETLEDKKLDLQLQIEDLDSTQDARKIVRMRKRIDKIDFKIVMLESTLKKRKRTGGSDSHTTTSG